MNLDPLYRTRRDLRIALIVLTFNTALLICVSVAYLRVIDLPQPKCLHPATFRSTQLDVAAPEPRVEVWL